MFDSFPVNSELQHGRPFPVEAVVPTFEVDERAAFELLAVFQAETRDGERVRVRFAGAGQDFAARCVEEFAAA